VPTLLGAVEQMAHRVQVHHKFARVLRQAAHAQRQETGLELLRIVRELVAARAFVVGEFQAIERGRGRQRDPAMMGEAAILAERIGFVADDGQQRVAAHLGMIVEVFVPQRQSGEALHHEWLELVIDEARVARVVETFSHGAREAQAMVGLAEQQRAAVGGERAAGEIRHDMTWTEVAKQQRLILTSCRRRGGKWSFHLAQ
jgi:hypothetical protein